MRHNVWILDIGNNDLISSEQALEDLHNAKVENMTNETQIIVSKRGSDGHIGTNIGEKMNYFRSNKND